MQSLILNDSHLAILTQLYNLWKKKLKTIASALRICPYISLGSAICCYDWFLTAVIFKLPVGRISCSSMAVLLLHCKFTPVLLKPAVQETILWTLNTSCCYPRPSPPPKVLKTNQDSLLQSKRLNPVCSVLSFLDPELFISLHRLSKSLFVSQRTLGHSNSIKQLVSNVGVEPITYSCCTTKPCSVDYSASTPDRFLKLQFSFPVLCRRCRRWSGHVSIFRSLLLS